jgi:hypothetical protein
MCALAQGGIVTLHEEAEADVDIGARHATLV